MSSTKVAPTPGSDAEFERIFASVNEALDRDTKEGAKIPEDVRRETLARALAKYGGRAFEPAKPEPPTVDLVDPPKRELTIPDQEPTAYWYEDPADRVMMDWYIAARVALGPRLPGGLLVTGPAGSGKTLDSVLAAERYNAAHPEDPLPLLVMNCPTITDPQRWFGRREVDAKGTHYERSTFVEMVEAGAIIVLDEFMRLHPTLHNSVMSLLDRTEQVLLSDLGITVKRHPRTVFIGTTNQGAQFGGTHRMDWAMRERWSYTIERGFPPPEEEVKILLAHNPGCDADAAQVLVDIAEKTRRMWETGDLRSPISTRTLDNAALIVAGGQDEEFALRYTALAEYDAGADGSIGQETDRAKVAAIIAGRIGR